MNIQTDKCGCVWLMGEGKSIPLEFCYYHANIRPDQGKSCLFNLRPEDYYVFMEVTDD